MTTPADQPRHLLDDLRTYLQQRQQEGEEWFLDAGPVSPDSPAMVTSSSSQPTYEDRRQGVRRKIGSLDEVASEDPTFISPVPSSRGGTSVKPAAGRDSFAVECEKFVAETIARIDTTRRNLPTQGDMFTPVESQPRSLDRREKAAALADLAAEVASCTRCKLHTGRTQAVFGVGDPDADLVFIGEAPGRDEDRQGEPFVGRAGRLLTEVLKAIDFERADVYICNILKCHPPSNRDPEKEEVDACEPYLKQQLQIIEPRIICCLGRVAAQTLLGTRASLSAMRETIHFYEGIPIMVTFHTAALLRNPHWKRPTWDDVRKLRALYDALRAGPDHS